MHTRIRYKIMGGHVHCRVFVGESADLTHALAGDLCFRRPEWEAFKLLLLHGCGPGHNTPTPVELVDETGT